MNKSILAIALTATIGLTGCATKSDLADVRAMAVKAQASADQANQTAQTANARANEADVKADLALEGAGIANEKIDRMFKKTMNK
ncbi:MAG: hypothetical protein DRQ60_03875 [Gammaproteobacteria bacterium]|nr:MAG: hypothetical protein DRQ60_03875 [Gammaproteobacteria bacterium]